MKKRIVYPLLALVLFCGSVIQCSAQSPLWHGKDHVVRYQPEGENFVIRNGKLRFNRALYGSNTAFRVEAGDLPEFALYMPGMGGNMRWGLIKKDSSKWLIEAQNIKATYRPGSMWYDIQDALLENGSLQITVLPLFEGEGLLVKVTGKNIPSSVKLFCAFGGASGKKFSRDGDIGADPESSFYLKPEYCTDNEFQLHKNSFTLHYGSGKALSEEERYEVQHLAQPKKDSAAKDPFKTLTGIFPPTAQLKISDAAQQETPIQFFHSAPSAAPALTAQLSLTAGKEYYFFVQNPTDAISVSYERLPLVFQQAEAARKKLSDRIKVTTPDPFINTIGGALSLAADAIWEDPSFLHGAVAWRMRLNAWRGPYVADPLGWHNRAHTHFSSYALSQVVLPLTGPVVADTALHLARQLEKMGTSLFSSGYICRNPGGDIRPHHYDMNLVFVDELLNHFCWTGDTAFVRQMWPLLQRHLDWEKRNFDADNDGLYDAYCCIWASDAVQYSGGGVMHASAYNFRANKMAAELAEMIGEDGTPYRHEAAKILTAINQKLWMPDKGWFAEYKDLLGLQLVHSAAGLWTIYHSLDSGVPDPFQAYQSLNYIDHSIPHIPIRAKNLNDTSLYVLSTSNWQPYTWSVNNVALAELLHTALAYWQSGRKEDAYRLWKSAVIESMYMSSAPGNFEQLSFYDAIRGELYRDFADPVGMAARSLVEGLFGIFPNALHDTLYVQPGFPQAWDHAAIHTPDIDFSFQQKGNVDVYTLLPHYPKKLNIHFQVNARRDRVEAVKVNGNLVPWRMVPVAVGHSVLQIKAKANSRQQIEIVWKGNTFEEPRLPLSFAQGEQIVVPFSKATVLDLYDPQQVLSQVHINKQSVVAEIVPGNGNKTFFVQVAQGKFTWWVPVNFLAAPALEISAGTFSQHNGWPIILHNNTQQTTQVQLWVNGKSLSVPVALAKKSSSPAIHLPASLLMAGSNRITVQNEKGIITDTVLVNWDIKNSSAAQYEPVDLSAYFNDQVTGIFRNQYFSPRPASPTLQLPTQGIGNWAYPLITAPINDSGLRLRAGDKNEIRLSQGVPLATPGKRENKNILFTSMWDTYPDSARVPLTGKAAHAYLMLAGSTNPMQSRLENGRVTVYYKDGSSDNLALKNPETWWPIEQDYYVDGFAFTTDYPKPVRVYLKTGEDRRDFKDFTTLKGFTNMAIDGGAATVLDLPLNGEKELSHLVIKTVANDVVIGLMSVTLVRKW